VTAAGLLAGQAASWESSSAAPPERKLSLAQGEQVRALARARRSLRDIAAEFGVSHGAIWRLMHADDVAVDEDEDAPEGGDALRQNNRSTPRALPCHVDVVEADPTRIGYASSIHT
jgi:hypothetical protein